MDQVNSLEVVDENDQLITPAQTPSEEDYRKPFEADEVEGRHNSERSTPRTQHGGGETSSRNGVRNVTVPLVRKRSVTLPSSSPLQPSQSPTHTPRLRKAPSSFLDGVVDDVPKLSAAELSELTSTPESLPVRALTPTNDVPVLTALKSGAGTPNGSPSSRMKRTESHLEKRLGEGGSRQSSPSKNKEKAKLSEDFLQGRTKSIAAPTRPLFMNRSNTLPYPPNPRRHSTADRQGRSARGPERPRIITPADSAVDDEPPRLREAAKIPDVASLPLPPFSIPTHLHLELSSERPSPLYIQTSDTPYGHYESSKIKLERLLNFLLIPPQLEQVLLFGALTCLDSWLYTFTILPLRFIRASIILLSWILGAILNELMNLVSYAYAGLAKTWRKRSVPVQDPVLKRADSESKVTTESTDQTQKTPPAKLKLRTRTSKTGRQRRSTPSLLGVNHKADLLQGLLIIISCVLLMQFDASRIYHAIRGQSAMKLYVIYNVLEVFDRLFSALGQDIIECLFSAEVLERKANGRSRIFRPFWMFLLALVYTVLHAMAFFYQVITLNVAVNSYSNALLTLLMSNQFVEIKGTVFKKIEKENLFQLTCADVVERFQLWLMLLIIALRNIVELGGLSIPSGDFAGPSSSGATVTNSSSGVPFRTFGILPNSFTILPSMVPAQVLVPFLVVLGSEMLVDWVKHAYITKFNATSPAIYGRFLDVLAKDYYSNAFAEQNLMRRLGLPVIPLACLFIRAALQTYHMFLATNVPPPLHSATTTLALDVNTTASPVIAQIDNIFRNALGRSSFGGGNSPTSGFASIFSWTLDDGIAFITMLVFFVALYLVLLVFKLVLGMVLLRFARDRYKGMKAREREKTLLTETKRLGGWGTVEVGDERRKIIYEGDEAGLRKMREREQAFREADSKGKKTLDLDKVDRYSMIAKRIW